MQTVSMQEGKNKVAASTCTGFVTIAILSQAMMFKNTHLWEFSSSARNTEVLQALLW
jgi:hypothetical protein